MKSEQAIQDIEEVRLFFKRHDEEEIMRFTEKNRAPTTSLSRLVDIASSEGEMSYAAAMFLLGLYNGHAYPFRLGLLRDLDTQTLNDCIQVLFMDHQIVAGNIAPYAPNGEKFFASLLTRFKPKPMD